MPGSAALRLEPEPRPAGQAWPQPVVVTGWGGAVEGDLEIPAELAAHVARAPFALPQRIAFGGRAASAAALAAAIGRAAAHPATGELPLPARRAIVVGTRAAAISEVVNFLEEIEAVGPSLVNPGLFPLTVMNAAAGLAAIEHRCEGPNITLNNGPSSALDAVAFAADLVATGRADLVFAGGFEGVSARSAAAFGRPDRALTVAAVLVVTTPARAGAGARPAARILAYGLGHAEEEDMETDGGGARREALAAGLALAAPFAGAAATAGLADPFDGTEPERTLLALLASVRRGGEGLVPVLAGSGRSAAALVFGPAGPAGEIAP